MPDSPFDLAGQIWAARPKPFEATKQAVWRGGLPGALGGLAVGGPVGAAVGAGLGTTFSLISNAGTRLTENLNRLNSILQPLIEHYRVYSPIIARLSHQWELLRRNLDRSWAQTIAPLLKQLSDIQREFTERWNRMKIEFFQAVEPYLQQVLRFLQTGMRAGMWLWERLNRIVDMMIGGFTKLLRILHLLPEPGERKVTEKLRPFDIEWPSVKGPLTGAMRRYDITGPPFTKEEERLPKAEGKEGEEGKEAKKGIGGWFKVGGIPIPWYLPLSEREKKSPEVNVEVKVGDSKELSAAFENVWRKATYELRKIEADERYFAYTVQAQGTYV